jgi:predicted RNA-binding protein with PUA-like domain
MTDRAPEIRLAEIAKNLAVMSEVSAAEYLDEYLTLQDARWLISEVQRLRALTDVVPVGEAAALLDIKPESVRHLMRRHGVTEVRGYPRAAVTGLRRTPPGRKRAS